MNVSFIIDSVLASALVISVSLMGLIAYDYPPYIRPLLWVTFILGVIILCAAIGFAYVDWKRPELVNPSKE